MDDPGRADGARTTPQRVMIARHDTLDNAGGVDDKRSTRIEDGKTARNFVRAALNEALAGRPVSTPTAAPCRCSVEYDADA